MKPPVSLFSLLRLCSGVPGVRRAVMRSRAELDAFWRDEQGSALILAAAAMMVLLTFAGLASDLAILYAVRQSAQNAADAAAVGGARVLGNGGTASQISSEGRANAATLGFVNGQDNVTVTLSTPPTQGSYKNNSIMVQAVVSQTVRPTFMGLVMGSTWSTSVSATAVASSGSSGGGGYCVLGLDTASANTVFLNNNATLPNSVCGIASNSTSSQGVYVSENAIINGPAAMAASSYVLLNNGQMNGAISTGVTTSDPYASVNIPSAPACTSQTASGNNKVSITLSPGHFCNGLDFSNNATVTMQPGVYYVDSKFSFNNNAQINASGVTIVINGNYPVDIGNNAILNITAPTSGNFSGIAMMGVRNGSTSVTQRFSNNAILNIVGALYFPSHLIQMDNNSSSTPNGCIQLIAQRIAFYNNADLPNNCTGMGTSAITPPSMVKLVQ